MKKYLVILLILLQTSCITIHIHEAEEGDDKTKGIKKIAADYREFYGLEK